MSVPPAVAPLSLEILGLGVRIDCADPAAAELLLANCGAMLSADPAVNADLGYRIRRDDSTPGFILTRTGGPTVECADLGELSFALEKDLIVELQLRRRDLLFLHAAVSRTTNPCHSMAAASRSGKSTTAWALLHHEFQYLSDELAPIDLATMTVLPFPHALCLKHAPAAPYALPGGAVGHGERIHVSTDALPSATITAARPLAAVFVLSYRADIDRPQLGLLGPAEASARLYTTALNPLAHPRQGLDAVVRIAEAVPCFSLASAGLAPTCALIRETVARVLESRAQAA